MMREGYNVDDKGERVDAHVLHFFPSLSLLSLTDHGYSNNTRWVVNGIGHILALAACKWCVEDESLLSIWS